jgi:tRNA-specific 2-thiouridylase
VPSKGKVLVAMSGGVDSSVAAALLLREGYEVVGCFMRLGSPGETVGTFMTIEEAEQACAISTQAATSNPNALNTSRTISLPQSSSLQSHGAKKSGSAVAKIGHQGCCSINDANDARVVAGQLGVPFYVCNFKKDFGRIIDYFVDEYANGRTPNPCVRCNDWLKFGKLHEYAKQIGADFVASGHYARVDYREGSAALLRGIDHSKDQSYVLFGVPRAQLSQMLLPIGGKHKTEIRAIAKEFSLPVFDKPDSQEICFVPDNDYAGLVEKLRPELISQGEIVDSAGNVLGMHNGQHHFTIGQRRGLGLAMGDRVYVTSKDAATNRVVVGDGALLQSSRCIVGEANWLVPEPTADVRVLAKYRYNTPPAPATARVLTTLRGGPSGRSGSFEVVFDTPQTAVAAGQALVLYSMAEPELVLGGGWIGESRAEERE